MDSYDKFCNDLYMTFWMHIEINGISYLMVSEPYFCPDPKDEMSEEIYEFWKDQQVLEDHYEVNVVKPGSLFVDLSCDGEYCVFVHVIHFLLGLNKNEDKEKFNFAEDHQVLDCYDLNVKIEGFRYQYMRTFDSTEMTVEEWIATHSHDLNGPYVFGDQTGKQIDISPSEFKNYYVDGYFMEPYGEIKIVYIKEKTKE